MNRCDDCLSRIDFYLDDELREDDLEIFKRHIDLCASCREELDWRHLFVERVRSSRPLYVAPSEFRDRISQMLEQEQESGTNVQEMRPVVSPPKLRPSPKRQSWSRPLAALAASAFVVAGTATLWTVSERQVRANAFVETAITTHQREVGGRLSMELRTNSEAEVTQWFAQKVPFHFRLPSYSDGQKQNDLYTLKGARLVAFKGDPAAYITYRMGSQPISLLVTSASSAIASGGDATVSRGIAFHSHRRDGLQVVTWSVHGLTYALVSSVSVSGRQSCIVCHADPKDKELLRGANPRPWHVAEETPDNRLAPEK
jgi:anti-sigma factor RsiW